MKLSRIVDVNVRVGEGRSLQMQEEVFFALTGEEAVQAVFSDTEGLEATKQNLKYLLNNFATFLNHVPDAEIEKLEPKVREMICTYLNAACARFELARVS